MSETNETKTEEVAQAASEGETKTEEKPAETEQTQQQQEGEQQTTQEQPPESEGAAAPTGEGEQPQQQEQATQPQEQAAEQQQEEEEEEEEEPDDGVPIVLVTGASGYIATHVISLLLQQGRFHVRGTVRNKKREEKVKPLKELVPDAKYPLRLVQADLLKPKSWAKAVKRCSYVFHIASPFPSATPRDENELITPAVEGTKNVLKACVEAGTVKRVVLTSSVAAVSSGMHGNPGVAVDYVYTEKDWSDESACPPYEKSKLKAEQAAWDFMKELEEDKRFELAVVNPGYVQGPILSVASGETSVAIVTRLLGNKIAGVPKNVSFSLVDVRDVAAAHIAAMEKPEAAGNRYLLVAETWTFHEMAVAIANEFKPQGYKIPTKQVPKVGLWFAKIFDSSVKSLYSTIGKHVKHSNEKMKGELGVEPRPMKDTIIDMCYNIIEMGLVRKTRGYLGHPSTRPQQEEQPKAEGEGAEAATGETTEQPAQEQTQEGEEQKEGTQEAPQTTEEAPKEETQEAPKETPDQEPTTTEEQKQETPTADEPKTEEQKQEETTTEQTEETTQEQPTTEEPKTEEASPQETTEQASEQPPESSEGQTKDESGGDQPQESSEPQEGGDQ